MCSRGPRGKMAEGAVTEKTVLVCLGERKYGTPSVTKIKDLYRHIRSLFRAEISALFRAGISTLFRAGIRLIQGQNKNLD